MRPKYHLYRKVLYLVLLVSGISIFILLSARVPNAQAIDALPVAYWKMEEGVGTTVVDSAGNGHDLFLTSSPNTPQWSTDVPPLVAGDAH